MHYTEGEDNAKVRVFRPQSVDAERRRKTVDELRPLHAELVEVWEKHTEDPTLLRRIQAWPADAERGPAEARG